MKRTLPPLNGLRAFEAAARHMSFTDAAEELSVTQAAISHQVRGLEQRLGLKLFVRRNRSLLLSEAGQAYLPSVRAAFDQLNEATEKLLQKDRGGHLTVTTTASFATKWLVPRLGGFQRSNPEIDVRVSTGTGLIDFSREDVDIGIRYGRGQWPGLHADWLKAQRARGRTAGVVDRGAAPVERLLGSLSRDARLITVMDGHPLALSWLGSVRGQRVGPRGIEKFGQSGDIQDLYATYKLDATAIIDAVARAV